MSVEKINDSALAAEGFFHTTQKDVPGKTAQEMKDFFDRLPREVLIPKINAIIDQAEADKKETAENLNKKADGDSVYTKTEADALLKNKADGDSVYTKTEADAFLKNKADGDSVYTKTEADALLKNKADGDSVYTKTEADALLKNKADGDSVYTKTEADKLLKKKIDANKATLEFANALKGTASGCAVGVGDVSPVEHEVDVKAESKNLFTTKYYNSQYNTTNRELKQSNSFSFTSAAEIKSQCLVEFSIYLEKGNYYLSGDNIVTSNTEFKGSYGVFKDENKILYIENATAINSAFSVTEDGIYIFRFYGAYAIDKDTVYTFSNIQLERGSTKTDFTSFVDVSPITVKGYKGNIANIPDITFTGYTYNMKDYLQWYIDLPMGATFTVSANGNILNDGGAINWRTYLADGSSVWIFNGLVTNGARKSVTATKTKHFELTEVVSSQVYSGSPTNSNGAYYKNFTINIGDKDLGYDAYEQQSYTPDEDGNIKATSLSPNMTFVPNTDGVTLDVKYNRDVNKAFAELQQAIISLGGTV